MSQIKVLVFDFHGTCTDHNRRLYESIRQACLMTGLDPSFADYVLGNIWAEQQRRSDNADGETTIQYLQRKLYELNPGIEKTTVNYFSSKYKMLLNQLYYPIEGLQRSLRLLREMDVMTVFLTNGTAQNNDFLTAAGDYPSYSWVIHDLLTGQLSNTEIGGTWEQVYDAEGPGSPIVLSTIDDMSYHLPTSAINNRKPAEHLARAMHYVIGTLLDERGEQYNPDNIACFGDNEVDVQFAAKLGAYPFYLLKGVDPLTSVETHDGVVINDGKVIVPIHHALELPFRCATPDLGMDVIRSETAIRLECCFAGVPLYVVDIDLTRLGEPTFTELFPPEIFVELSKVHDQIAEANFSEVFLNYMRIVQEVGDSQTAITELRNSIAGDSTELDIR